MEGEEGGEKGCSLSQGPVAYFLSYCYQEQKLQTAWELVPVSPFLSRDDSNEPSKEASSTISGPLLLAAAALLRQTGD